MLVDKAKHEGKTAEPAHKVFYQESISRQALIFNSVTRGGLAIRAFGQCPVGRSRWVKNGPASLIEKSAVLHSKGLQ